MVPVNRETIDEEYNVSNRQPPHADDREEHATREREILLLQTQKGSTESKLKTAITAKNENHDGRGQIE